MEQELKKTEFTEVKGHILNLAKAAGASCDEYKKAIATESFNELLIIVRNNVFWCYNAKIFSDEILRQIPEEELTKAAIFYNQNNVTQKSGFAVYYNSTSEHFANSTSEHFGSSTSKHYESSASRHHGTSTSEHFGSSTSKHYSNSTSIHYENSTSKHHENSTSKHYRNSTSIHYENSTSKHYGSSTSVHYHDATSEHYDKSYHTAIKFNNNIHDMAICRELNTNKVYIKKDTVDIVIID